MVNKREAIDSLHNSLAGDYRHASGNGTHIKSHRGHTVYTAITAVASGVIAITMVLILAQIRSISSQGQRNGEATVNYLDCIGHIEKPVAQRTQADYDKCLDDMRATVKGYR